MNSTTVVFRPAFARRIPDPVFHKRYDTERHIFVVPVRSMPKGIGNEPNARRPNPNKQVYRGVEDSLLNRQANSEPNSFHLKNKGIVIIADRVVEKNGDYYVELQPGQGIIDGGHTYALISKHLEEDDLPEDQHVFVEVRTGIQREWMEDISGGLNTTVQVQAMSLDNLAGRFSRFKAVLAADGLESAIAWSENDPGDMDARDLLSILICFNTDLYKNNDGSHPIEAYSGKASVLKKFEDSTLTFERLTPIMLDILYLHDHISHGAAHIWSANGGKTGSGGKPGSLIWMDFVGSVKKKKPFVFKFARLEGDYRLKTGALYPILSAFRQFVENDPRDPTKVRWAQPFSKVLQAWESVAIEMLRDTAEMCAELGNNPNALGKSKMHWNHMYALLRADDSVK